MELQTKKCSKCGKVKDVESFRTRSSSADGFCSWCKLCCKEYQKKYYEENKDKAKEYDKKYYEENKDKKKEYQKKYDEENKDKVKERQKKYKVKWLEFFIEEDAYYCKNCEYNISLDGSFSAIDFHHTNPEEKESGIAKLVRSAPNTKNKQKVREELEKCISLCTTCHREIHDASYTSTTLEVVLEKIENGEKERLVNETK